jgi:hypothetical protein
MPGAAVRVLRIAAGWRALQLVLVVGGLFAIALLCGERAYAADGVSVEAPTGSTASAVSSVSTASATASTELRSSAGGVVERILNVPARPAEPAKPAEPARPAESGVHDESTVGRKPHHPAPGIPAPEDRTAQPRHQQPQYQAPQHQSPQTAPHLVQPVGDVVRTVTEGLVEGLAEVQAKVPPLAVLPSLPSSPSLPTAPEAPAWPNWPGLELPAFPEIPDLPGTDLPALPGTTLPAPVTGMPQPGTGTGSGSDVPAPADGHGDKGRTRTAEMAKSLAHGPHSIADVAASHAVAVGQAHRASPSGDAPGHGAPTEHPRGVVGGHAAGDSGTPRHGDAHAVSLSRRVPWGLVAGAVARVDADEISDRHRDIPVSPA